MRIRDSGVAAARMLSRLGARLTLTDTRNSEQMAGAIEQLRDIEADWRLGTEPDALIGGKDYIILSPSVYYWSPWVEKAKQNGTVVVSELQLGAWFTQGDFVAVTGTNGKTTTTTLIGEIFKANGNRTHVLGNIGVPVCTEALDTQKGDVIAVSYTHLDVYKRQLQEEAAPKQRWAANLLGTEKQRLQILRGEGLILSVFDVSL